jgi:hypothetical protein
VGAWLNGRQDVVCDAYESVVVKVRDLPRLERGELERGGADDFASVPLDGADRFRSRLAARVVAPEAWGKSCATYFPITTSVPDRPLDVNGPCPGGCRVNDVAALASSFIDPTGPTGRRMLAKKPRASAGNLQETVY